MADNNIFVYIFPWNKKWREQCGTFFLFLFRSKNEPWNQRFTRKCQNIFRILSGVTAVGSDHGVMSDISDIGAQRVKVFCFSGESNFSLKEISQNTCKFFRERENK